MATNVHIEHIADTIANIRTNMDEWQDGFITDNTDTNITTAQDDAPCHTNASAAKIFVHAMNKYIDPGTGAATYLNAEFNNLYAQESYFLGSSLVHIGDTDTNVAFTTDSIEVQCGGVVLLTMTEDSQDIFEVNATNADVDFTVNASGVADALFVLGSSGNVGVNTNAPGYAFDVNGVVNGRSFAGFGSACANSYFTLYASRDFTAPGAGNPSCGFRSDGAITGYATAGHNMYGALFANTFVEGATSGTHAIAAQVFVTGNAVGAGAASTTLAASLYISAAMSGAASNYALYSAAGSNYFGGNVEILLAGAQLKLSYDGTYNSTFSTGVDGNLTITPSGGATLISSTLSVPDLSTISVGTTNGRLAITNTADYNALYTVSGSEPIYLSIGSAAATGLVIADGNLVGVGTASPDRKFHVELEDAVTNAITYVARLTHTTSGTAAVEMGVGLEFEVESGYGNTIQASIAGVTDPHNALENSEGAFDIYTNTAASLTRKLRIDYLGNLCVGTIDINDASKAEKNLVLANGVVPTSHIDNQIFIGSKDSSDSASTLALMLEQAVEDVGTFTPSKKIKVWINNVEYWIQLDAV